MEKFSHLISAMFSKVCHIQVICFMI